ncbi:MAG: hypothetical protein ACQETQ_10610 [Spirochaetota bacterium]
MITRTQLTDEQARYAMEHGEFPQEVREAATNVAVVLTQGWCPQWTSMNVWLKFMQKRRRPKNLDITIFEYIYDKSDFFVEFMHFKEGHFGNAQVPYIRYYKDGSLTGESNYVTSRDFLTYFEEASVAEQ